MRESTTRSRTRGTPTTGRAGFARSTPTPCARPYSGLLRVHHFDVRRRRQPMMAARRPVKSARRGEGGIAEAPDGDAGQVWKHFEAREQADAASRTERGLMPAPGRAHGTERPHIAFDLHRVVGKEGGVGEGAAAAGLTIEAGAGIDDSGRAPCGDAQCTAGAGSCSRVFAHARPQAPLPYGGGAGEARILNFEPRRCKPWLEVRRDVSP